MRNEFEKYQSNFTVKKDWVFPYDAVPPGSKIILYGAGDVGQAYFAQLKKNKYCDVLAWADKDSNTYCDWGIPVVSPKEALRVDYERIVIAVSSAEIARAINDDLLGMGVPQDEIIWIGDQRTTIAGRRETFCVTDTIRQAANAVLRYKGIDAAHVNGVKYISEIERLMGNDGVLVLPRVVVELTTFCTLKCKGCNNLMPMYNHPTHCAPNKVISDIEKVTSSVDRIIIMELIGGEPFCYPYLDTVLRYVLDNEVADLIEITTNGTLVPNETTLQLLANDRIVVRISRYKNSTRADGLVTHMVDHGINYSIMEGLIWTDPGEPVRHNDPRDVLMNRYHKCPSARLCKTLFNGKLFTCARAASLYDLGFCDKSDIFVDLESADLRGDIYSFIRRTQSNACDYCYVTDEWRTIQTAEQI